MSSIVHAPLLLRMEATSGDARARAEAMFAEHYPAIWRTLRRLGVPDADADDAAQAVFVAATRRLSTIRAGDEGRYLYGVALRVASEVRRRHPSKREAKGGELIASLPDEAPGPEEVLLREEARGLLDEALAQLPEELLAVFVLVEIEELSLPVVAEVVGVPLGTATSRLRRARDAFDHAVRRVRARITSRPRGTPR